MGLAIIPAVMGWTGANVWWALRQPQVATQTTPTGSGQAPRGQE
jgi:hypothetical protein